jgi:hypothetical protein
LPRSGIQANGGLLEKNVSDRLGFAGPQDDSTALESDDGAERHSDREIMPDDPYRKSFLIIASSCGEPAQALCFPKNALGTLRTKGQRA